jgi:glucose/arabinose dehydrogenase/PKD repeat protein
MTPAAWSFTTGSAGFVETVVFSGLIEPTTIQFAADGRIFVAEKRGVIKVFDSLTDSTPDIFADLRTRVHNYWDRGLLGMALHPNFPAQPYVYILYTHDAAIGATAPRWGTANVDSDPCPTPPGPTGDGCIVSGRLSRLQAAGNVMTGTEQVLIEDWGQQYPSHTIGSLVFGPDGALYVSGGDGASFTFVDYGQDGSPVNPLGDPPVPVGGVQTPPTAEGGALRSQDLRTAGDPAGLNGAVLRLDPNTGAAMAGNPLIANADLNARRIIAYGLRNPFRFTFKPGSSQIFVGDVGWTATEEINRIANPTDAVVENFGWPCYEGNARQAGYDAADLSICENLYAQAGAVTAPVFSYAHGTIVAGETCATGSSSTSGVAFYANGNYPAQYRDALFLADYSRSCIWVVFNGANGQPDPSTITPFREGAAGPVDLKIGPNGDLFYVDLNGTVRRFQYFDGNSPPVAVISASPSSGSAPLTVNFNGSSSSDPNPGDPIAFAWDLDNDGQFDDGTGATAVFTYATAGVFTARLRVTDSGGLTDVKSATITTSGAPPAAAIQSPAATLAWSVGQTISFSGSATDPEDGILAAARLSWQLNMHHCPVVDNCHVHPVQQFAGVASGSFAAPDHDYPSFLELVLTATDSSGQTNQKSVRLDPQTTVLSFSTSPAGLPLAVGSSSTATPFTRTVIVGSNNSLSAPQTGTLGANSYEFVSWSDGGAATHNVAAPGDGASYVATYSAVPSMSIDSVSVSEVAGGTTANFTVSLSSASAFTVTASFATSNGTATAGSDYVARTGTVTFAPGVTAAPIQLTVNDDALDEVDETFLVTLSNPLHAAIVGGPGTGTITDNDAEPTVTIDDATVAEGNTGVTMATFVVRLSAVSGRAVTGNFGTANGTASGGSDYTATSGPFSIPAGSTTFAVQVPILGDVTQEPDETFVLTLSTVSGAIVADAQASGTIRNDDVPAAGGIVAAYSFEESSGTTTADTTGKGHTGTVAGTDWADDGKHGRGLWFPGSNNWVTIADANDLDLTNGMTVEAWVNPFSLNGWNTVLMKEAGGSLAYGLYANDGSPWPAVTVQIGGADRSAVGTSPLPLSTWSHVAATYDGTTLRLYRNGVQIGSRAQTGNMLTSTGVLRIGGNAVWGEYFHGVMDDVRIYNRALTAAEIQSDMNTPVQ